MQPLLLCCDLDRTLIPNGRQPESPEARPRFRRFVARPEVVLAYVSGRHRALLHEAVERWGLPLPDYAIGDVGTTIYRVHDHDQWEPWDAWSEAIAPDWRGRSRAKLAALLDDLPLRLQEPEKQNTFKLSYYAAPDGDRERLLADVRRRLEAEGVRANLIWSIDEMAETGLLDVLPAGADKVRAIRFLMAREGFGKERTVFAGDSGNDLPVVTSGLQSVLVANTSPEVRREALARVTADGRRDRLYIARGGFDGMNGNYAAGVLEGVAHFLPSTSRWMTAT